MSAPPFTLVGLDHVVFLVDDMEKALDFYGRVLGCTPGYSYPRIGMEQVWCGAALIVLWDISHPGAKNGIPAVAGGPQRRPSLHRDLDVRVAGDARPSCGARA